MIQHVVELQSLTDHQAHAPALPAGHPFTQIDSVPAKRFAWTSTSLLPNPRYAQVYDLFTGAVNSGDKFNERWYAWPVRGGELGANYLLFLPLIIHP